MKAGSVACLFCALAGVAADPALAAMLPKRAIPYYEKYSSKESDKYFTPGLNKWVRYRRETKLPPYVLERKLQNDTLLKLGYLNLKHYAKGDGVTDDTRAIMDALYDAYFFHLALYVPPGTYMVSDTLDCAVYKWRPARVLRAYGFFVIGDPGNRPVFKLKDGSTGFQSGAAPKPVLRIAAFRPGKLGKRPEGQAGPIAEVSVIPGSAWLMNNGGVSSVIIDCGRDNPGAVGLEFGGAQAAYVENVRVLAYGATAGIKDLIGNAGYMANLEVRGGRYGFWFDKGQNGGIAGLTLIDQTEYAIVQASGAWPLPVAGFRIEKQRGPVARLGGRGWSVKDLNSGGHLSLCDGVVILKERSLAFENLYEGHGNKGKDLYLRNVYVKNAGPLIHSHGCDPVPAAGEWSHIREYAYAGSKSVISIDGTASKKEHVDIVAGHAPGQDPAARHALQRRDIPTGLDPDAVSLRDREKLGEHAAVGDGVHDDTEAFRYAVRTFKKILVPKGSYVITGNVQLGEDTVLFGITSALSVIIADVGRWKGPGHTPVFSTVDDADAETMISQLSVYAAVSDPAWPPGRFPTWAEQGKGQWENGWPLLDWRAGSKSVVKNFYPRPACFDKKVPNGPVVRVSGNGGGRWYAIDGGTDLHEKRVTRDQYVHVLIENTHEPLKFYGWCVIHGRQAHNTIVRNSRNLEWYGVASEDGHAIPLYLKDCRNVLITGCSSHFTANPAGIPFIKIEGGRDITVSVLSPKDGKTWTRIQDDRGVCIPGDKIVAYYRSGPERNAQK